ncbi:MAG: PIN domain-containing protein [Gemmatimonadales bacterium]|nr:PIN domain-containing protein [Gemmatimonadales bacterium]
MLEVFVDSGFWCATALRGRTDADRERHERAGATLRQLIRSGTRLVTTNLVLAETHQLLLIRDRRDTALAFLRAFPAPGTDVVPSTAELEAEALADWIEKYDDQDFSLADAVSLALMKRRRIKRALAYDRHFAAAGFEMLP